MYSVVTEWVPTVPTQGEHIGKTEKKYSKEVKDKLYAWFDAHEDYPYPSKHENAELMEATGLNKSKLVVFDSVNSFLRRSYSCIYK